MYFLGDEKVVPLPNSHGLLVDLLGLTRVLCASNNFQCITLQLLPLH